MKPEQQLKKGECGGQSCTPEMEEKMTQTGNKVSLRDSVLMQRGVARNGRVIRKAIPN